MFYAECKLWIIVTADTFETLTNNRLLYAWVPVEDSTGTYALFIVFQCSRCVWQLIFERPKCHAFIVLTLLVYLCICWIRPKGNYWCVFINWWTVKISFFFMLILEWCSYSVLISQPLYDVTGFVLYWFWLSYLWSRKGIKGLNLRFYL